MRTQSPDTSLEAERMLIERIRQASVSKRFRLVQSLSQRMLSECVSGQTIQAGVIHTISSGYGQRIGKRVATFLTTYPHWQEQQVDLSTTLYPVIQALSEVGISSYIGGSIATSIHGMQQSAADIDLVLASPKVHFSVVRSALTRLQDQYLVEVEELTSFLSGNSRLSLIHKGTLMKIDVILPKNSAFDEAMQSRVISLIIDERYAPFPVASALEMVVWKLARCADELAISFNGIMDDIEWNDVLGVLKVQGASIDFSELKYWVKFLNAEHLLLQCLNDAGIDFYK